VFLVGAVGGTRVNSEPPSCYRHSTTWATPPALFDLLFVVVGGGQL
jgi:hypothetical protein